MAFEIRDRDLIARIGRLKTKSGFVETPSLLPVINPVIQPVLPKNIQETFGYQALIVNAYILKKRLKGEQPKKSLHKFLDFSGPIMTDSGAYQILIYGDIDIAPKEIVEYQEQIDTDIATILDWPTGWKASRKHAEQTVNETLTRAKELFKSKTRKDILWVGPVQGGRYLDLVAHSAREMAKLPFEIHALGSPTEVMAHYRFDVLVEMIMAAKMNLPLEKPLHLFGAGHPLMFSLAVALGCDLFDSAAYAIYARDNRYMTEYGTLRLAELEYFPCTCPRCSSTTSRDVSEMQKKEKEAFLAEHNLFMCQAEMRRIKQAIKSGRLWEHLEMRAHGHPTLLQALKKLKKYQDFIEKRSPVTKESGIFIFNSVGLVRPCVVRHRKKLSDRYTAPEKTEVLLLVPQTRMRPFRKSREFKDLAEILYGTSGELMNKIHVCFYTAPFGIVPIELDEVYPLSQHETVVPLDKETIDHVAKLVAEYVEDKNYETVVLLHDPENWSSSVLEACETVCSKRNIRFEHFMFNERQSETCRAILKGFLQEMLSGKL